jgi:Protein of unknown function (DUF2934)
MCASQMELTMGELEEKIRARAYEIWERQGRTGNPEDHWLQAERELKAEREQSEGREDQSATVKEAPPADAVRAAEAVDPQSQGPKRSET